MSVNSKVSWSTPITLSGPIRTPTQMLKNQEYAGHSSIHDDAVAQEHGFTQGTIEGPVHHSQFTPLLTFLWDLAWFERGCLSLHFHAPAYEGDRLIATAEVRPDSLSVPVALKKDSGELILSGSASIPPHPVTEAEQRMSNAVAPTSPQLMDGLTIGMRMQQSETRVDFETPNGSLYPFSLSQKLAAITEPHPWYSKAGAKTSPWGRPILPLEMVSVLTQANSAISVRQPSIALYLDQEIRMIRGPLFVDHAYLLEHEVVALSESRRTESYWVRTSICEDSDKRPIASTLLHVGVLKDRE